MSLKYICKRCNDKTTTHINDLKKHLIKKKKCPIDKNTFLKYSNDQILVLSLIPYENEKQCIDESEIEHLKKSDKISKNMNQLFDDLCIIQKDKLKCCKYCNKEFPKISDLKKHVLISCFLNEIDKKNKPVSEININGDYNLINNSINNNFITNNNNVNIYLNMKNPVPFDDKWNISEIDRLTKIGLIFSNFMYSELLERILENENNLNIVIDKDNNLGMVYKNDIDKYIEMKSKDIVCKTMEKLHDNLLDITKSDLNSYANLNKETTNQINKKYKDYLESAPLSNRVNEIILAILDKKREDAKSMAEKVISANNIFDEKQIL
jgi:hypothetical protein